MALIKKSELKQMKELQLNEKLVDLKKEMMKINSQRAVGTIPEKPGRVKEVRKTIARILTKLNQIKKEDSSKKEKIKEVVKKNG